MGRRLAAAPRARGGRGDGTPGGAHRGRGRAARHRAAHPPGRFFVRRSRRSLAPRLAAAGGPARGGVADGGKPHRRAGGTWPRRRRRGSHRSGWRVRPAVCRRGRCRGAGQRFRERGVPWLRPQFRFMARRRHACAKAWMAACGATSGSADCIGREHAWRATENNHHDGKGPGARQGEDPGPARGSGACRTARHRPLDRARPARRAAHCRHAETAREGRRRCGRTAAV